MNNEFASKLKELREKKFPGQSLRRVGEILASLAGLGDYFYTQLHKMEAGSLIPSPNLLLKIMQAYDTNDQERKEILIAYSTAVASKELDKVDEATNEKNRDEAVHQLYRKVKKKNQ